MWNYVYMILTIILQITYKWFQKAANSLQTASVWGRGNIPLVVWESWDLGHIPYGGHPIGHWYLIGLLLWICVSSLLPSFELYHDHFGISLSSLSLLLLLLSLFLQLSLCVLSSLPSFLIIHIYLFIMITTSILYVYSQRDFIITTLIITIVTIIIIINMSQKTLLSSSHTLWYSYWKSPFLRGKLTINGHFQ